jgi:hypothetical protein
MGKEYEMMSSDSDEVLEDDELNETAREAFPTTVGRFDQGNTRRETLPGRCHGLHHGSLADYVETEVTRAA